MSRPTPLFRAFLLAGLAALLPACGTSSVPEPARTPASPGNGDRLVLPIDSDPPTLNFIACNDVWCRLVARFVADSLIDEGVDGAPVGRLAESWEFSEGGKLLTFRLREGVRWHDGAPFSSADVVSTYRRTIDPASGARADLFQDIESVEAPDDRTVRVRYRNPTVLALEPWKNPVVPASRPGPGGADPAPAGDSPVGTGPFRFISWERGSRIVLAANSGYFRGRPHLDGIVLRVIPSAATQLQALLSGDTDWSSVPAEKWAEVSSSADFRRRFQVFEYPALFLYYVAWNEKLPVFSDPRVRTALTLALDRKGYLEKAAHGAGVLAASTFHPRQFGFDPGLAPLPFDPDRAASLLDQAGWHRDPRDGLRRRKGREFRFTLLVFQGNPLQGQIAALMADSLARLGVRMEIRPLDFPALLDKLRRHDFDAAVSGWALTVDPDPTAFFHSTPALGTSNYVSYADPELDGILVQARHEFEPGRRRELYHRAQAILARDQPYTFLLFPLYRAALDGRFHGVVRNGAFSPLRPYPGILEWFVPRELQKRTGP